MSYSPCTCIVLRQWEKKRRRWSFFWSGQKFVDARNYVRARRHMYLISLISFNESNALTRIIRLARRSCRCFAIFVRLHYAPVHDTLNQPVGFRRSSNEVFSLHVAGSMPAGCISFPRSPRKRQIRISRTSELICIGHWDLGNPAAFPATSASRCPSNSKDWQTSREPVLIAIAWLRKNANRFFQLPSSREGSRKRFCERT